MSDDPMKCDRLPVDDIFVADGTAGQQIPIWTVEKDASLEALPLSPEQRAWIEGVGFKGTVKQQTLVPGSDGRIAGVLFGLGDGAAGEPSGSSELLIGQLAQSLPAGSYRLANDARDPNARRHRLGSRELSLRTLQEQQHAAYGEPCACRRAPTAISR